MRDSISLDDEEPIWHCLTRSCRETTLKRSIVAWSQPGCPEAGMTKGRMMEAGIPRDCEVELDADVGSQSWVDCTEARH